MPSSALASANAAGRRRIEGAGAPPERGVRHTGARNQPADRHQPGAAREREARSLDALDVPMHKSYLERLYEPVQCDAEHVACLTLSMPVALDPTPGFAFEQYRLLYCSVQITEYFVLKAEFINLY